MQLRWPVILTILLSVSVIRAGDEVREVREIPHKGEQELNVGINFGLGEMTLLAGTFKDLLHRSEITYSRELIKPVVEYKTLGNRGRLRLYTEDFKKDKIKNLKRRDHSSENLIRRNQWRMEFSKYVPVAFDIDLGLGRGEMDFSSLKVTDLNLECGLSDVRLTFTEPNKEVIQSLVIQTGLGNVDAGGLGFANIERFQVECGLGSTTLNFDGNQRGNIKGKISVGLGTLRIGVPRGVGVEVETERSFLSSINLAGYDEIDKDIFRSRNWRESRYKIFLMVEIGLGSIDIYWLD